MALSILERLQALVDSRYREFSAPLLTTVEYGSLLGVRTPAIRQLAKEIKGSEEAESFLRQLPHRYHEENLLHAILIANQSDYATTLELLTLFLPYANSWAITDVMFNCRSYVHHRKEVATKAMDWIESQHPYTCRYGIGVLMYHAMPQGGELMERAFERIAAIRSNDYYVNMMVAWFFATSFAQQWDAAIPYMEQHRLPEWTYRKAIRKAIESYRVSDEHKAYLRSL